MNGRRRLALVGAASAAVVLSVGTAGASARPTEEHGCHGFFASEAAHELGGIGRGFMELEMSPSEIGDAQQGVRDICKAAEESPE